MNTSFQRFLLLSTIATAGCYVGIDPDDIMTLGPDTEAGEDTTPVPTLGPGETGISDGTEGGDGPGDTSANPGCSAETCAGCCDGAVCRTGDASGACGQAGAACQACAADEVCEAFECTEVCRGEGSTCQNGAQCCSDTCDGGACTPPNGCSTCEDLGHACGDWLDGCGGKLHCGTCNGNDACVGGTCECQPKSCAALGKECGSWSDGCGGMLNCGSCPENYDCEAGVCEFGCESETFFLHNAIPNAALYSVACEKVLQEFSYMYVCTDPKNCTQAVPAGGYATYELAWGAASNLTAYCCLIDGTTCFGQDLECNVDGQKFPCTCTKQQIQLVADVCPSEDVVPCK